MSHYLMIPINENGIIFDTDMNRVVAEAMAVTPFNFRDIYVYSHGWSNDAAHAMDEYNQFSIEFSRCVAFIAAQQPDYFVNAPADTLGIGIHWPSEITEDPESDLNKAQLLTFYTMEHRADAVGKNAVYSMLRLMLQQRVGQGVPPRFHLLGHSFGCKVVLAALQDLRVDIVNETITVPQGTTFNVVLLEPATDSDNLEENDIYGDVPDIDNLRMLITKSQLDQALVRWFHLAGVLANVIHKPLDGLLDLVHLVGPPQALGAVGPTAATIAVFGGDVNCRQIVVDHGFNAARLFDVTERLIVADLTPVHQYRIDNKLYDAPAFAGSHSDINFNEIYQLVAGFFFGVANNAQAQVL